MNHPHEHLVHLHVQRGTGDGPSHTSDYAVPAHEAASLLDGLRWVRAHLDDTLAVRYSCINANACKECMMRLDGKVVYACTARLQPGSRHAVAPMGNKARLRDLVSEVAPAKERLFAADGEDDGD